MFHNDSPVMSLYDEGRLQQVIRQPVDSGHATIWEFLTSDFDLIVRWTSKPSELGQGG